MSEFITNLEENHQYFKQSLDLIEQSFNYQRPYHYKDDFSLLFQRENLKNCYILVKDNRVLATAFTLPRILKQNSFETPVIFIGGLAAHPDIRGQGIFKQFFQEVKDFLEPRASLLLLWSALSDFYQKFNFYEAGSFAEYSPEHIKKFSSTQIRPTQLTRIQREQIKNLYHQSTDFYLKAKRNELDWDLIFNHPSIHFYIEENTKKEITNYWLINKGMDLQNICHESSSLSLPMNSNFKLWHPQLSETAPNKYMAFISICDTEYFQNLLNHYYKGELMWKGQNESASRFIFKGKEYTVDTKEFIQGVFGPGSIEELQKPELRIWIPGFESV